MSNRSISGWLIAIVFLGVLVGIAGGAVMGGVVGYYVAASRPPVVAPAAISAQPIAANPGPASPPVVTNITVNENSAIIDTVKKVEPAVVTIISELDQQPSPFGQQVSPVASGSGVIIDQQGHVVTNAHVIDGAKTIQVVYSDGSKADASPVGSDSVTDVAVLQVSGSKVPASAAFGDSNSLQLGETVIAIGSPLGSYRGSVTLGVISGMNRSVKGTNQEGLIQTDAAINHGNSGGPLVNLGGQIVGINTLVVRDTSSGDIAEGLGFSIPSNTVKDVVNQLLAAGKVDYPFIGINYEQITPQIASESNLPVKNGLVVLDVVGGSPASKAGIRQDDIVIAVDNNTIDEEHSLRSILFKYHIGDQVTLQIYRNGQTIPIKLTLVARPAGQ